MVRTLGGYVRACHPGPTAVVTLVVTVLAWAYGWRGIPLAGLLLAVLAGQLSVGWSNDAFDAALDLRSGRTAKPTVRGSVHARGLWVGAVIAVTASVVLSIVVAGAVGGGFHVLALASAWAYNLRLSRTAWSWLPYAVSFGAIPMFLSFGLDGVWPAPWQPLMFAIIGVSAHLANALPDVKADRDAGVGGAAVRLGAKATAAVTWILLSLGTCALAVVAAGTSPLLAAGSVIALAVAVGYALASTSRAAMFHGLMAAVVVDAVVLLAVLAV